MHHFWIVIKLELFFIWRNWATWLIALAMLVIGALAADNNLSQPWQAWEQFTFISLFLALILTFSTGNQINRDRERRLDGVIFSTPIATPIYVLAKYSAALFSLLALACFSLLAAILTDQFYEIPQQILFFSPALYPSFGPQVYLLGWLWLLLIPLIFGATFIFACTTLTRGKRVIAYIVTFLVWLIPAFSIQQPDQRFFDVTAVSFMPQSEPAGNLFFQYMMKNHLSPNTRLPAQLVQQIMALSRADIPPASTVHGLLWDRLFFLAISIILLCVTIYGVQRIRRSA